MFAQLVFHKYETIFNQIHIQTFFKLPPEIYCDLFTGLLFLIFCKTCRLSLHFQTILILKKMQETVLFIRQIKCCCPPTVDPNMNGYAKFQEVKILVRSLLYVGFLIVYNHFLSKELQRSKIEAPQTTAPTAFTMNQIVLLQQRMYHSRMRKDDTGAGAKLVNRR